MTRKIVISIASGMLISALASCGDKAAPAGNEAVATDTAATDSMSNDATTTAVAPASANGTVTADYMVGKWSAMEEDCSDTLDFRKDGSVGTPIGGAKWALDGDKLSIDFGDGSEVTASTIKPLGPDRIEITKASGNKETQKRC